MPQSLGWRITIAISSAYLIIVMLAIPLVGILGLVETGDKLTLIQTITELVLIPIAIIGFLLTINDLRNTQQLPALDLYWGWNDTLVKSIDKKRPTSVNLPTPPLILTNAGTSLSGCYQITLSFPQNLGRILIGDKWRNVTRDAPRYVFTSNEQYVAFPGSRLDFGSIDFFDAKKLPDKFEIAYAIHTDRAQCIEGKMSVHLSS